MKELKSLSNNLKSISTKAKRFSRELESGLVTAINTNVLFDYSEQELINRVFKSVVNQMKSNVDKRTAKSILRKTGWLERE